MSRMLPTVSIVLACPLVWLLADETVLRSSVRSVEVSVIATDSKGEPVRGLTASDFHVFDNGKAQAIATFEQLDSRAGREEMTLPAGTWSNRVGSAARPQVLSMILLDAENTKARMQTVGRQAVAAVLEQIDPAERVAIYVLGARFSVIHDFSSDRASLLARLNAYHGEVSQHDDLLPEFDLTIDDPDPPSPLAKAIADTGRAVDTLETLRAIAKYAKGLPGRKNLLWVSESFPMEVGDSSRTVAGRNAPTYVSHRNFGPEMKKTMDALNDANVSVYPIYARGLSVCCVGPGKDPVFELTATMKSIAGDTGGKAFVNSNDRAKGVRQALDDSRVVYEMSFYPKALVEDGSFHQIRVRTSKPGVELRSRSGYFANGQSDSGEVTAEDRLQHAAGSPLDVSEIGLQASVYPAAGGDQAIVAIRVDPKDLAMVHDKDRWTGALILSAVTTGVGGERFEGTRQAAELNLTPESYERALAQGLRFSMAVKRGTGAIAVRIGVADQRGPHAGSLSIPLRGVR